jgi:hypothetical protein
MGGIDWNAIPIIVEMLGIEDVEEFILNLTQIREFQNRG